jgi:hypothetical protein
MEFSDSRFLIPRQAGWPKFFVADAATNRGDNRWLLVFTRGGIDEEWLASYLTLLPPADVPEFTEDEDGYAQPVAPTETADLAMSPAELAAAYAGYLQGTEGTFAEGSHTTGILARRDEIAGDTRFVVQRHDTAAEEPAFAPVALRTTDGALVFFSTHHVEKQVWADGLTPVIEEEELAALVEGTVTTALTTKAMAMQSATLPTAESTPIPIHSRLAGVLTATGE